LSGGTFSSFVKADANTGAPIWYRGGIGSPLGALDGMPGAMRFCPSVIIGDYVYFGGDNGNIYKLDKNTGLTAAWVVAPYSHAVWMSPTTDGTNIYIGCAIGLDGGDAGVGVQGALYKYNGNLGLVSPYLGNIGWNEGVTGGCAYNFDEDALYFQVEYAAPDAAYANTDGFTQKAEAATMNPHPDNSYFFCGIGQYAVPGINPALEFVFFANRANRDSRFSGLWVKTYDFNTAWQDFTKGDMIMSPALSCDPYVFWGTQVPPYGTFNCSDAQTGALQFSYNITGYGFGAAIARYDDGTGNFVPFVAHTQLYSDCETGGGRVTVYSQGPDRPRLFIPSYEVEIDPPLDFVDPDGSQRSADVFCNVGCTGLKYCLALDAHPSYPVANFGSVNPQRLTRVDEAANRIIEYSIHDFNFMEGWKEARMNRSPMKSEIGDRPTTKMKDALASAAPPSWVTLVSPDCGILRVDDCYEGTFAFTVSAMNRGMNLFYVAIATDDPDYNECNLYGDITCCHGSLPVNDFVLMNAVKGFAFCDGYLDFGDGGDDWEYVTNAGWFDDGNVGDAFTVDGTDDPLFQGGFYYAVDSVRVAWQTEAGDYPFNHLFADTVCTLIDNAYFGDMYDAAGTGTALYGDYFETAVIDSIYDMETGVLSSALTIGMRLSYREYGVFGPLFNNFKVIAYDLYNRNATPVDDLYWGLYADWDMPGDAAGYEQVNGNIPIGVAYQFNEVSNELAGFGTLPMPGSFIDDGSKAIVKTTGMYNGYGISNPDEVYDSQLPFEFFRHVDDCAEGSWCYHPNASVLAAPDDRGMILTAGKKSFGGNGVVSGAFLVFNYPGGASTATLQNMMELADKFCGYKRGDLNDDGEITLNDLVVLILYLNGGNPPYPFEHLGDVNADGVVDAGDASYFYDFFFNGGPELLSALAR
jgi:hypothetical protein